MKTGIERLKPKLETPRKPKVEKAIVKPAETRGTKKRRRSK